METNLFDKPEFLHFIVGVIFYYMSIGFRKWMISHLIFEIIFDTRGSIITNNIAAALGWGSGYYLEKIHV